MKLIQSERETLIGPALVGVVAGIFLAICTVAFNSEYKAAASAGWSMASDVMLNFFAGFLVAFVPFGLLPVLIGRIRSAAGSKRG
jgi:hypothetical protein